MGLIPTVPQSCLKFVICHQMSTLFTYPPQVGSGESISHVCARQELLTHFTDDETATQRGKAGTRLGLGSLEAWSGALSTQRVC